MTTNKNNLSNDKYTKYGSDVLPEPFRKVINEINDKMKIAAEVAKKSEGHLSTFTKPLPQILNEMDENIRAVAEAARRAELAARAAVQAAVDATKAANEAEKRAEEARKAGQMAAKTATKAAVAAAAKAEEVARLTIAAVDVAVQKAEQADAAARAAAEAFKKAADEAVAQFQQKNQIIQNNEALLLKRIESLEKKFNIFEDAILKKGMIHNIVEENENLDRLLNITLKNDPVLAEIWDNEKDSAYDKL